MSRTGSIASPKTFKIRENKVFSKFLLLEILILCLFPWPFYEIYVPLYYYEKNTLSAGMVSVDLNEKPIYYFMSDFFIALMFLRLYFVIRCLFSYSIYTDAYSKKLC